MADATGTAIRAYGYTKDLRPAIVLRQMNEWLFVAYGTTQVPHPTKRFYFVDRGTDHFESLGLDRPTYYVEKDSGRIKEDDSSIVKIGPCPPAVLLAVRSLYGFK